MKTAVMIFAVALSTAYAYRDCYMCSSADDHKSSKNCDFKKPDVAKINSGRWQDTKKECIACYKWEDTEGEVIRGCASKDDYRTWKDTFNFKNKDSCKKEGDTEICLCEANLCNGSSVTVISFSALLFAAFLKMLF